MAGAIPGDRPGEGEAVRPPAWAGPFVGLLLGAMVVAFVAPVGFGLWPITSWELFSRARSAEQAGYAVDVVAADGTVNPLPFGRLGPSHRHWRSIAIGFPAATPAERTRACEAWAAAAQEELGAPAVAEVRVHRVVRRAADRATDPPVETDRALVVRCTPP